MISEQDVPALVHRNAVVYRCLTPDPAQALLFGNGNMGGSVHTPDDSLYLLLCRSDIWNEKGDMGAIAAVRIRGRAGLFANAARIEQVCDPYDAAIRIRLADAQDKPIARFTLTCVREQDVLLVDIEDFSGSAFEVTIANWHEGDTVSAVDGARSLIETVHVNRSSAFAEHNTRVRVDAAAVGTPDPLLGRSWGLFIGSTQPGASANGTGTLRLPAGSRHRIVIATACHPPVAGTDAEATLRAAGRTLATGTNDAVDDWLTRHRQWWTEFWSRSYIALESATGEAEYEERVWYINLYYLACAHGGAYPARFNGGPFPMDKDKRGWDGYYTFQNMRELYWPLIATGHWEWMRDFFRMYRDCAAFTRAQTRELFGIDALSFREAQTFWGRDFDSDLTRNEFGIQRFNFDNNLEICLLMDWYYQASGDETFLRDKGYPLMKQLIAFYLAYAKKEADGCYHLAPANALEVWPDTKDPMTDIAGLRRVLPRLIAWGEYFGEDAGLLARWREFLEHLAPIPVGYWTIERCKVIHGIHLVEWQVASQLDPEGMFLPAADKTSAKMERRNMENPELYVVFPWGLVGLDSPPEERRRFEVTWHHRTWKYINNGWAQDVLQLARMGWSELAKEQSIQHASYGQRFPNGGFISPAPPQFHDLLTAHIYLDSAGVHIAGLNEMLLQSYAPVADPASSTHAGLGEAGILRLAPAVSAEWSGHFKLHALGGFVVEAAFTNGQPTCARIVATRANILRLRNHRREAMIVGAMRVAEHALFEKPMQRGEVIEVAWEGIASGKSGSVEPRPTVIYPAYKVRPPRAAHPTGHWHDERKDHGQIGLAEDGLFPATRTHILSQTTLG